MSSYEAVASYFTQMLRELMASRIFSFKNVDFTLVPKKAGVYLILDEQGEVIYIGRTANLNRRLLGDHMRGNVRGSQFRKALMQNYELKSEKQVSSYIKEKCSLKFKIVENIEERIRLEHFATAVLAPILNIKLKQ